MTINIMFGFCLFVCRLLGGLVLSVGVIVVH